MFITRHSRKLKQRAQQWFLASQFMSDKQREQVDKVGKVKIWVGKHLFFKIYYGGLHIIPVVEVIHFKWMHFILYKSDHSKVDLNNTTNEAA